MSNIITLENSLETKRLRGQWSGVMNLLEKIARSYGFGSQSGNNVNGGRENKYKYWISMAEVMIEHVGDHDQALACISKARALQVGSDPVAFPEWKILLTKYLLVATSNLLLSSVDETGNNSKKKTNEMPSTNSIINSSSSSLSSSSHNSKYLNKETFNDSGTEESLRRQFDIFFRNDKVIQFSKANGREQRWMCDTLINDAIHCTMVFQVLAYMDIKSRTRIYSDVLHWMRKQKLKDSLNYSIDHVLMRWIFSTAREMLYGVDVTQLVKDANDKSVSEYNLWLRLDAVIGRSCLSTLLGDLNTAADDIKGLLNGFFPSGDIELTRLPPTVRKTLLEAICRLPILEVSLGRIFDALSTYKKCISVNSKVRTHIPVPTRVGMIFSAAILLLQQQMMLENDRMLTTNSHDNVAVVDASPFETAFSLLISIRQIMTMTVVTDPDPWIDNSSALSQDKVDNQQPAIVDGGSLHPIQNPRQSFISRLPLTAVSPLIETEFVTPGRVGVTLWVLIKKLKRTPSAVDLLEWSSSHEIHPDFSLLWSLGCAYEECGKYKEALSMFQQCHEVCTSQEMSPVGIDAVRNDTFLRLVEWLDPEARPKHRSWLPIIRAARIALHVFNDVKQTFVLLTNGLDTLYSKQKEWVHDLIDISQSIFTSITNSDPLLSITLKTIRTPQISLPDSSKWDTAHKDMSKFFRPSSQSQLQVQSLIDADKEQGFGRLILCLAQCFATESRDSRVPSHIRILKRQLALKLLKALERWNVDNTTNNSMTRNSSQYATHSNITPKAGVTREKQNFLMTIAVEQSLLLAELSELSEAMKHVNLSLAYFPSSFSLMHLKALLSITDKLAKSSSSSLSSIAISVCKDLINERERSNYMSIPLRERMELNQATLTLAAAYLRVEDTVTASAACVKVKDYLTEEWSQSDYVSNCSPVALERMVSDLCFCSNVCSVNGDIQHAIEALELAWNAMKVSSRSKVSTKTAQTDNILKTNSMSHVSNTNDGDVDIEEIDHLELSRWLPECPGWRLPKLQGWKWNLTEDNLHMSLHARLLCELANIIENAWAVNNLDNHVSSVDMYKLREIYRFASAVAPSVLSFVGESQSTLKYLQIKRDEANISASTRDVDDAAINVAYAYDMALSAIRLDDRSSQSWQAFGEVLEEMGDHERASDAFFRALSEDEHVTPRLFKNCLQL